MGFSKEWDNIYKSNQHLSVWPWSNLVSLTHHYGNLRPGMKVLELGCGAGANIPFFLSQNVDYYAIEGSSSMVKKLQEKFQSARLYAGDFTKDLHWNEKFDLIVDRSALTHNATEDILRVLSMVKEALKTEGHFISMDWFSVKDKEYMQTDVEVIDEYTHGNFQSGYFKGLGRVHFSDKEHLLELFKDFHIEYLAEKTIDTFFPQKENSASWDLVVKAISKNCSPIKLDH